MFEKLLDPQVLSTVSTIISVLSAIITALLGQVMISRKRLQEKLAIAQGDISYLLAVEAAHCEKHRLLNHASFKLRIRKEVSDTGLVWSGRFTPGRVRASTSRGTLPTTVAARFIVLARITAWMIRRASAWCVRHVGAGYQQLRAASVRIAERRASASTPQ